MRLDGHYDGQTDLAWPRCDGYDSAVAVARDGRLQVRELDITHRGLTDGERVGDVAQDRSRGRGRVVPLDTTVEHCLAEVFPSVGVRPLHDLSAGLSATEP